MVRERDDVVGMDGSILMNRQVWVASGHENTFTDPMEDCRNCKSRLRADQLPEKNGRDRKSTRLNSSHQIISYAVFCLKKKKQNTIPKHTQPHLLHRHYVN